MADKEFRYIVRIADRDLPGDKNIVYALALLKGIGVNTAYALCRKLGIDTARKLGSLTEEEISMINEAVRELHKLNLPPWLYNRRRDPVYGTDRHFVGADLVLAVKSDIEFMKEIKSWRGIRHMLGLKVRGQRTRTTGRTGITIGVKRSKS
ncbi:MAG: 30S ribosomal protein S13 [Thermofilaceae archaeon]|nr:30S ribosomal protein S13 [Thermofilaceae archaeon]MCX8181091.1 30S ribosomal protein S13 [Thermofilaceae archaeon]MDW8004572.1 30S ribosomal protein S13 [Thermofilaceae archaeon]